RSTLMKSTTPDQKSDIYQRVTAKLLADLEKGQLTWRKPWNSEHMAGKVRRPLRWNQVPYSGINTLVLWATAADKGYQSPYWMTFHQALELKANVRKGEKGEQVVYADKMVREEQTPEGETDLRQIPFLKTYTVFNADQIEGLPASYYPVAETQTPPAMERDAKLETFFSQTKAEIVRGKSAAYYSQSDRIEMPPLDSFETIQDYYAVLSHELCHWTKHPTRLNRDLGRKRYGDEGYAKEELVAELGACFLGADLGFEPMPELQHAAYLQSWLEVLQNDKRFIFTAASHAQKAVEYLHGLQGP
ncbi:ArdC family protein, partial [Runella zeae]|uniref:ArdC family protein n=1 Tax=Runella zeae TaxID=94255 RepID=UPI00286E1EA5